MCLNALGRENCPQIQARNGLRASVSLEGGQSSQSLFFSRVRARDRWGGEFEGKRDTRQKQLYYSVRYDFAFLGRRDRAYGVSQSPWAGKWVSFGSQALHILDCRMCSWDTSFGWDPDSLCVRDRLGFQRAGCRQSFKLSLDPQIQNAAPVRRAPGRGSSIPGTAPSREQVGSCFWVPRCTERKAGNLSSVWAQRAMFNGWSRLETLGSREHWRAQDGHSITSF